MKNSFVLFCLLCAGTVVAESVSTTTLASKIKFPKLSIVTGKVLLIEKGGAERPLKKDEILKEKALIKTLPRSIVQIELDEKSSLTIFENSEVSIPGISWDDGSTERIELNEGEIRYRAGGESFRKVATLITDDTYPNADMVLSYSKSLGRTEMLVMNNEIRFRGLENEEDVILKRGQKGAFQAILEGGIPAFDILLKGRRVARGKLTPIATLSEAELAAYEKKTETKSIVKALVAPPVKRQPGQICEKPFAKLNECVWMCEGQKRSSGNCDVHRPGVQCVRKVCNANGVWADSFAYPPGQSKCQASPIVGPCDY